MELPFFDDFSNNSIFPSVSRWEDNKVYVNSTFADNPPTIGVATFDAIDFDGKFYSGAAYQKAVISDYLTSKPINLNYPGNNSIYLSFYFQPQGNGDAPESADSLILEFFSVDNQRWNKVWFAKGAFLSEFKPVVIQITEPYLRSGFKFRFKNYVSLSSATNTGLVSNCDFWNIDYVYINKNRTASDLIFHDIAFLYPLQSFLKNYESVPWKHFKKSTSGKIKTNLVTRYKNNDNSIRLIDTLKFIFSDLRSSTAPYILNAGSYNVLPLQSVTYNKPFIYPFSSNISDSAEFSVKAVIVTDGFDSICNNTLQFKQLFYDYYAYDDGSAELGYGLTGEGVQNAMVAYKFFTSESDTLKAAQIYFNRSLNDANKKYFYLTVWSSNPVDGTPDKILYKKTNYQPYFENSLNKFHNYNLYDTVLVLKDTFFIGWTQTTNDFLNVGLDINRDAKSKLYYNVNGQWKNSSIDGAVMMRPVFGKPVQSTSISKYSIEVSNDFFPNPASDFIRYQNPDEFLQSIKWVDLTGRTIMEKQNIYTTEIEFDISSIPNGIYFILYKSGQKVKKQKIIISR